MNLKLRTEKVTKEGKEYTNIKGIVIPVGEETYEMPVSFKGDAKIPTNLKLDKNGEGWITVKECKLTAGNNGMKLEVRSYEEGYNKDAKLEVPLVTYIRKDRFGHYQANRELYNPNAGENDAKVYKYMQVDLGKNGPTEDVVKIDITNAFLSGYVKKDGTFEPKLVVTDYTVSETREATTPTSPAPVANDENPFEAEGDAFDDIPDFE